MGACTDLVRSARCNGNGAATEAVLFGLALAGINEQSGYHIADGRADTQRDVKRSDELNCRHGGPRALPASHIVQFCRRQWCGHTDREVPPLTINSGCKVYHPFLGPALSPRRPLQAPSRPCRSRRAAGSFLHSIWQTNVRFTPKSGHVQCNSVCPLWARSELMRRSIKAFVIRSPHWGCAGSDDGIVAPNAFAVFQVDDQIEFDRGSFQRQIVRVGTLQQAIYNCIMGPPLSC